MKNRASSHLFALLLIIGFEIVGYYAIHRAALIRGYETSWITGARDLLMYVPVVFIVFWLTRSSATWLSILAFIAFCVAFAFCVRDNFLLWMQRHSFMIVVLTLIPLRMPVAASRFAKAAGNITPWEPSKIPFLLGFAGILTAR